MLSKIKDFLHYGGISKEKYAEIHDDLQEINRNDFAVVLSIAAIFLTGLTAVSFVYPEMNSYFRFYLSMTICTALAAFIEMVPAKKNSRLIYVVTYLFTALIYAFGILLGVIVSPGEPTVTFVVLLFAIPLLITDYPVRIIASSFIGIVAYFLFAVRIQSGEVFITNVINIVFYGLLSSVVAVYLMKIKVDRTMLERRNRFLSESDQLTGLLNRRSCENHFSEIRKQQRQDELIFCEFDINGLKWVNDTFGHHAGDELIRAAAEAIKEVFGPYGECYRVGGDEFVAIIEKNAVKEEDLIEKLNLKCGEYIGKHNERLSLATGLVEGNATATVDDLMVKTDQMMYLNKSKCHQETTE